MAPWVPLGFARIAGALKSIRERYPTAAAMLADILLASWGRRDHGDVAAVAGELKVDGPSLESPAGSRSDGEESGVAA
jgi:hypothetical protein